MVTRQRCEIFSRICGYIRPISQWNPGKISELKDRKLFKN
jgi:anaerobic ribonucleoside-triphosphate reductase